MGVQVIPIHTEVVSHSLPFPFPILCFSTIPMGFLWDSRSYLESHSHAHLYSTVNITRPQKKRVTNECLVKRSGVGRIRVQLQLEEDGAAAQDTTGWRKVICGLCDNGVSQVSQSHIPGD